MRLVCVSGQQGTQDVTEMSFKQATDVFRTAGRPVTLTLSLPDQQGSQLQVSADEQAQLQSALEKLQALQAQAVMVAKSNGAAPPHTADAQGAGGFDWDGGWGPQSPGISRRGFAAVEEGLGFNASPTMGAAAFAQSDVPRGRVRRAAADRNGPRRQRTGDCRADRGV